MPRPRLTAYAPPGASSTSSLCEGPADRRGRGVPADVSQCDEEDVDLGPRGGVMCIPGLAPRPGLESLSRCGSASPPRDRDGGPGWWVILFFEEFFFEANTYLLWLCSGAY